MSLHFKRIEGHDAYPSAMAFALYELDRKFFPTPWTQEDWMSVLHGRERFLSVILDHQEVIGFSLFDLSSADSFAHLLKILIHPERRSQGLGAQLLRFDLNHLKTQGITHYFLEVEEDNHAAQKLYQTCGFKKIHQKKDFYGRGRHALIMTAELL